MKMPRARKYVRIPLRERFEEKFTPEPNSGCWLWTAATLPFGYGVLGSGGKRGNVRAHHAAWRLYRGDIPDGMWVLHKCDNPACVNPDHLFLGSHRDNVDDCMAKRRTTFGARNAAARLSNEQARSIFQSREHTDALATRYRVSGDTVRAIRAGRRWSRVTQGDHA